MRALCLITLPSFPMWSGVFREPLQFATANPNAPVEACERIVCNFYIDGVRYSDEFLVLERML